jgi:hypothetical protein
LHKNFFATKQKQRLISGFLNQLLVTILFLLKVGHLVLTKIRNMNYDQTQNLSTDSSHLLKDTDICDVIIKVGKKPNFKKFKAHSHILSSKSAYFEKAFSAQWARKEDGFFISNQPNISPGVFEILIK